MYGCQNAPPGARWSWKRRNTASAEQCQADFAALKRLHPYESAQLWVGMVAEAALIEHQAGTALPDIRKALEQFLN